MSSVSQPSVLAASESRASLMSSLTNRVIARINSAHSAKSHRRKRKLNTLSGVNGNKRKRRNDSSINPLTTSSVELSNRDLCSNKDGSASGGDSRDIAAVTAVRSTVKSCALHESNWSDDCGESHDPSSVDQSEQSKWAWLLPVELLSSIFAAVCEASGGAVPALCRLARVCRLWRCASQLPQLWRHVDLSRVPASNRNGRRLQWLLQHRLSHVQHLVLDGWGQCVNDATLSQLASTAGCSQQLVSLSVAGCSRFTGVSLDQLARSCCRLSALHAASVQTRTCRTAFVAEVAAFCRSTCGRLRELSVAGNCVTSLRPLLLTVADYCHQLRVLDISNVSQRHGPAAAGSLPVDIGRLQRGCGQLRVLRWANTGVTVSHYPPAAPTAAAAAAGGGSSGDQHEVSASSTDCGFVHLREFSTAMLIDNAVCVNDSSLLHVLFASRQLQLLDIRGCRLVTAAGLLQLPAVSGATSCQQLYLAGCSRLFRDRQLVQLLQLLAGQLTHLDLSGCVQEPQLLATALAALTRSDLGVTSGLVSLDLSSSAVVSQSLRQLLARCSRLRVLDLTSCRLLERGIKRRHVDIESLRQRLGVTLHSA